MKTLQLIRIVSVIAFSAMAVTGAMAQSAGDYRSVATGNWGDASTWESFDGADWLAAGSAPDGTSGTITIQSGHTVTVASGVPITINGASIVVDGTLRDVGIITPTSGTWTVNSGGTYELAHATASGTGLPTATWNTGSTCLITGVTSATTGINANQSFYNLTVNCPSWAGSFNFGWNTGTVTIGGDVTVLNTGAGRWQFCAPAASGSATVNINGNLSISGATSATTGASVTSNGTSNGLTTIIINVAGNVTVTGNATNVAWTNFSISRGSQGTTGTTTWNLGGDLLVSDATMQNSNAAGGKFVFNKAGTQTLTLSNVTSSGGALNTEISSGAMLDLGNTIIGASAFFTVNSGGGVATTHSSGLDGNLTTTGTKTLSTGGNYTFHGGSAQVTGALLPATVHNLSIFSPSGLTLTNGVTVTGTCSIAGGASVVESAGKYVIGYASTIQSVGTGSSSFGGLGVSIITGEDDLGAVAVTRTTGSTGIVTVSSVSGIARKWSVTPSNPPTSGRDITFTWDSGDDNGKAIATGEVWRSTDFETTWDPFASGDYSSRSVTLSGVTSFGRYTVTDNASPLPAALIRFTAAAAIGSSAKLAWSTATEINTASFQIERKSLLGIWKVVATVDAAGNSNAPREYSYEDAALPAGKYAYRLKQIDNNGASRYIGSAEVEIAAAREFKLSDAYPNPFNPRTNIQFTVMQAGYTTLKIFNVLGQEVTSLFEGNADPGRVYQFSFDGMNLPSGIYFSRLESSAAAGGSAQRTMKRLMLVK